MPRGAVNSPPEPQGTQGHLGLVCLYLDQLPIFGTEPRFERHLSPPGLRCWEADRTQPYASGPLLLRPQGLHGVGPVIEQSQRDTWHSEFVGRKLLLDARHGQESGVQKRQAAGHDAPGEHAAQSREEAALGWAGVVGRAASRTLVLSLRSTPAHGGRSCWGQVFRLVLQNRSHGTCCLGPVPCPWGRQELFRGKVHFHKGLGGCPVQGRGEGTAASPPLTSLNAPLCVSWVLAGSSEF